MNYCSKFCRIGHDNFELVNHDIVNPLMIEGRACSHILRHTLSIMACVSS